MKITTNELGICDEALNVSQQHYPSTDSNNSKLKTENKFAKPAEIIIGTPPLLLFHVLSRFDIADGSEIMGNVETVIGEIISWKGTIDYYRRDISIKEIGGRRSTKGQIHKQGCAWLDKTSPNSTIYITFQVNGGAK